MFKYCWGNFEDVKPSLEWKTSHYDRSQKMSKRYDAEFAKIAQSMFKKVSEIGISKHSLKNIVKNKLRPCCYKINNAHLLDERFESQRLKKCQVMKRLVAGEGLRRVLFTDEKIFTVERLQNSQKIANYSIKGLLLL